MSERCHAGANHATPIDHGCWGWLCDECWLWCVQQMERLRGFCAWSPSESSRRGEHAAADALEMT